MKITRTHTRFATIAALMSAPLALIACSSSGPSHAGNIGSIRWDPSPAMHTLSQRDSDRLNMHAYTKDTNLRALSSDIDRMFYIDRPSRLSPGIKP